MNDQPLISVIIPVYNVEQYLSQCISSVINQTYSNLEIICVNDASTDRSPEILNQFTRKDQRIHVIEKQNEGVSRARNVGLQRAHGQYVMFVDADDWIESDTCEKALAAINGNGADIVMWSYVSEYGASNSSKTIFPNKCVFERQEILDKLHRRFIGIVGDELERPELADAICPVWGKLYKRNLIIQSDASFIDLAEIGTYEDGMFNLETFFYANKVAYLDQCLYHYRRNNKTSITSIYREELFGLWENLYQRMQQYIQEKNLPEVYNEALKNRIALGVLGLTLNVSSARKSFFEKRRELREILKSEQYHTALISLDISRMPKKWKIFYKCAKYGNASALLFAGGGYIAFLQLSVSKHHFACL